MKKKELGITEGSFSEKDGRVFIEDGTTICYLNNAEFESVENGQLISDAFNTANKCGLLPSDLFQWKHETLTLLKEIANDTERRYRFTSGSNWPKWYDKAINQIEQ